MLCVKCKRMYRSCHKPKKVLLFIIICISFFFFTNDYELESYSSNPKIKLPEKFVLSGNSNFTKVGLTTHNSEFYLNHEKFRILAGEVHYFRIPQTHWRHRLLLLKAAGLNTVSTYMGVQ